MTTIYTIGNGERTQIARRADGVWFTRQRWRGVWGKWQAVGIKRPYEFGMYPAPRSGKARLPDV